MKPRFSLFARDQDSGPPRKRGRAVAFLLAFAIPCVLASAQVTHLLDLKVMNGANAARVDEPVSFGVPVPQAIQLFNPGSVQIVDPSNQSVARQYTVLTRWGGDRSDTTKPIRWILVSFNANVPANATAIYHAAIGAPTVSGQLWAVNQTDDIEVHTGPNTWFRIYKWAFHLFDAAVVNGVPLVNPGRIDLIGTTTGPVTPTITETVLEEYAGTNTVRCVVRQRGQLDQLRFTCRWFFYSGRQDVTVDFRLENPNPYGLFAGAIPDGEQHFDLLHLVQPVIGSGSYTLTTDANVRPLATNQLYDVSQYYDHDSQTNSLDSWTGFSFSETVDGTPVGSGNRFLGAVDLEGSSGGVTVTLDRFWQNFPKSFQSYAGELRVGLFPQWGSGPLYSGQYGATWNPTTDPLAVSNFRFEGGRWKTHRMVFNFHQGSTTTAAVASEAARVNAPLIGTAPGSWIRTSGALGGKLWHERVPTTEPGEVRWERFTDILADDAAADLIGAGHIGYPAFIRRGGTNGDQLTYGWDHFGDIPWGDGYCSQHYDWTAAFLSGFWRTGDYRLFNNGRDVAVSRRDYNQNHSTSTQEFWRGASFYEKGYWHGNYTSGISSHNWLEGLLMYYAMTGDEAAREAAVENAAYIFRDPPKNWTGWWGSRIPGWGIDNLLSLYAYLGSPIYLNEAALGVYRYEQIEQAGGGGGYVLNPGGGDTQGWMENIMHIAACKYYLASGDQTVLPLLTRMRDWFQNTMCILPTGTAPNFTLPMVKEHWTPGGSANLSVHHGWAMCESFAYSAICLSDPADLQWSWVYFTGPAHYWQSYPGFNQVNTSNPATYSPITFRPSAYPGSESKVIGNLLRWGNAFPAAKRLILGE